MSTPNAALVRKDAVREALEDVRAKAAELREAFGGESVARTLEWAASRVEQALQIADDRLLSLDEAAKHCGYSAEHLARLVRSGRIPDQRPPGSKGRICIRARDLPMRSPRAHNAHADVHELASRLFGGREGRHGQP